MRYLVINLISFYQRFLSFDTGVLRIFAPGGSCRHIPSCSEYTKLKVEQFGVIKGLLMGSKRILTCI